MRLRKLLAALVATLSITGVLAGPAFAGKAFVDGSGSCADLSGAGGNLVSGTGSAPWDAAAASADIATAPCRKGSYVFAVYDTSGNVLATSSTPDATSDGVGGTTLRWFVTLDPPRSDSFLCATVRSLDMKGNLLDDATSPTPDANCAIGQAIGGPPAGGWM
jgi:hypothetical protein